MSSGPATQGGEVHSHVFVVDDVAQAAIAPIYTAADVMADPQFQALGSIVSLPDDELGQVRMQNVLFRLSETPGKIRSTGAPLGAHTDEVLKRYGVTEEQFDELRRKGVIR
ncbi:hypothetical protein Svir_18620 [Saccharomonospora viridis DSM 43017]|uniref:Acyl-CoA transferase/carnitine dehydratase n=1 Tax=Saccharomonospora viridis (strain ATCC 15386 / DSM 43017 / JCM 3036 / CCUG 5913 / NBRC 12207 / NCIMB 9602 / P101) TaxID=471857 RepID=C7MUA6_SACVD|nr:hypothetical protein Svir_18620 [Saccharomonospora viridis DSM 43017]